jgi:hypothetical protein
MSPARTPGTLFAQTEAPTPFHLPGRNCLSERDDEVGIVIARIETVGSHVDHFMPCFDKVSDQLFLQAKSTMVGSNPHAHL